jgi:hypothetical protein
MLREATKDSYSLFFHLQLFSCAFAMCYKCQSVHKTTQQSLKTFRCILEWMLSHHDSRTALILIQPLRKFKLKRTMTLLSLYTTGQLFSTLSMSLLPMTTQKTGYMFKMRLFSRSTQRLRYGIHLTISRRLSLALSFIVTTVSANDFARCSLCSLHNPPGVLNGVYLFLSERAGLSGSLAGIC